MLLTMHKTAPPPPPERNDPVPVSVVLRLENSDLKEEPKMSVSEECTPFNAVPSSVRNQTRKHDSKLTVSLSLSFLKLTLGEGDFKCSGHENDSIYLAT